MATEILETERKYEADLPAPRAGQGQRLTRHSPTGDVVLAYLGAQAARLKSLDPAVRHREPDSIHQMRVTVRRLRSTLQSFGAILPKKSTRRLRDELRWLGTVLGAARDDEVLSGHVLSMLAGTPQELVMGPVQARVRAHYAPREADAQRAVLAALDSQRYVTILDELDSLIADPPVTAAAATAAGDVLPRAVARACRRTSRRMRLAERTRAGAARDVALHETRKAAKRARYAAEAAEPAVGKKAARFAKRMKAVQSVLGDHQDAVNTRAAVREIGVQAHLGGETAFSYGLLYQLAHHEALELQEQGRRVWRRAAHGKAHKWLS